MTSLRAIDPAIRAGLLALTVGLGITSVLAAKAGWDSFILNDAVHFHTVALDLDASEAEAGDSAYRYGRVGLPFLARVLAFGAPGLLSASQMLVTPLAFGVLVAAAVATAARVTGRGSYGLVVLLVPGLWVGFWLAWADTLLAACVMVSIWATVEGRRWPCLAAIAAAVLTKEVGVLCALVATTDALMSKRRGWAVERVGALVPAMLWWAWVRMQAGEWPFFADAPSRASAIAPPLVDIVSALTGGRGNPVAALYALLIGTIGVGVFVRHPSSALAWSAGTWGLLSLCLGENVLAYVGDTLRVTTPATSVILLSAVLLDRARSPEPVPPRH